MTTPKLAEFSNHEAQLLQGERTYPMLSKNSEGTLKFTHMEMSWSLYPNNY